MTSRDGYWVRALRLTGGDYSLVDWSDEPFSKKDLRRAFKRFKGDSDVVAAENIRMERFFKSKSEMIKHFKEGDHG